MLDLHKVNQALAAKRHLFANFEGTQSTTVEGYRQEWLEMAGLSSTEITARLAWKAWPGARPSGEHDRYHSPIVAFDQRWENHEQARAWAREVLLGVPTLAVDGSQITPTRDFSLPVGAVQVGWFENPHSPDLDYIKDVSFEVLAPQELAGEGDDAGGFPDWQVNWQRFAGECRRLVTYMQENRGRRPQPVCFFDGSLIISFVEHMEPKGQECYVRAVRELLETSTECRVPLIGYVDTSFAADLVAMLDALARRERAGRVADGTVLRPLFGWGDRTPAWLCARYDGVLPLDGAKYYDQVAFVYLKTTADNPPARLDLPRWLLDDGQLDRVLDIVRAECVIGNGYPYAAETADAVAVITTQDRERFYAAFQRFAQNEGLPLRLSRKAGSKRGRR